MLRYTAFIVIASFLAPAAGAEAVDSAKRADIKRLLEITGSANLAVQMASAASAQMMQALRRVRPDIPEDALPVINRELTALYKERVNVPGGLIDKIADLYQKYFTHEEIKAVIAFYQTKTGRKLVAVLPQLMAESMIAGQEWGNSLAPEAEQRVLAALRREGFLPARQ
jgi:hypothetical protein